MVFRKMFSFAMFFVLAVTIFFTLPAEGKDTLSSKELGKYQGTWNYIAYERDGRPSLKREEMPAITFDGNKFTIRKGDKIIQTGTMRLYPTRKPSAVDAFITDGMEKGSFFKGIYVFEGEIMKSCFGPKNKKRPQDFKVFEGSGYFMVTLKKPQTEEGDAAEGERLIRKLFTDVKEKRISDIERMIPAGFQSVHQDGARSREDEIRLLKRLNIGDFTLSNFRITRDGNILIVTYMISVQEIIDGKKTENKSSPRLTVLSATPEGWKWVAHANLVAIKNEK